MDQARATRNPIENRSKGTTRETTATEEENPKSHAQDGPQRVDHCTQITISTAHPRYGPQISEADPTIRNRKPN
jgi:hypothetical protein